MNHWKHLLLTFIVGLCAISTPAEARFVSVDPVGALEHIQQGNVQGFNRYAYANNNPYKFTDPDGRNPKMLLDFGLNVALNVATTGELGLAMAAKETISGMLNPAKSLKTAQKLYSALKSSKKTGSYSITFGNGKTYDGKGPVGRMEQSMKEKAKTNGGVDTADWKQAKNDREALKDEHKRMTEKSDKGHKDKNSLNKRASPGKKHCQQDGDC